MKSGNIDKCIYFIDVGLSLLLLLPTILNGKVQEFNENTKGQNQKQDIRCKEEADKLFEKFVENLTINLTYDSLFDDIKYLQCVFVSTFCSCSCYCFI